MFKRTLTGSVRRRLSPIAARRPPRRLTDDVAAGAVAPIASVAATAISAAAARLLLLTLRHSAAAAAAAVHRQTEMLQNGLHLHVAGRLGADRRLAEGAIVQRHLRLGRLLAADVLAQGDARIRVQVEVLQRTVLHAQRAQRGAVDLRGERERE